MVSFGGDPVMSLPQIVASCAVLEEDEAEAVITHSGANQGWQVHEFYPLLTQLLSYAF